ncbi:hypothetical protein E1176_17460 [Fulvivirga sp. RKSG066]|uniref:hypothetical protein n=1 Tax=Fulvivirga aurantia TaxID=2529383 RepID=UPI0012BC44A7|nr:hypothetical protein [Fulvivirga aurantia]MTI22824.1 hypothetical protein [Fulvivirga aurantia]
MRFKFKNQQGDEVLKDPAPLKITDLQSNVFSPEREETETDSVFLLSLNSENQTLNLPDTLVFLYDNAVIDTAAINYGFKRDSECCRNPRVIEGIETLNLPFVKLIKREFNVYSITVE